MIKIVIAALLVIAAAECSGDTLMRKLRPAKEVFQQKTGTAKNVQLAPKMAWNYANVRKNAYMFWWLYYSTSPKEFQNVPLVIWLQGGPGASSTGFGNFQEIGPVDVKQMIRTTTWLQNASLLFIDNPVGTGFSYVSSDDAYTTNNQQIAQDLVTMLAAFLQERTEFLNIPLYIFSESYGGKMAAAFALLLYQQIQAGSIRCNFKGVAMGDSWISPIDSVNTWGPYLYSTSLIDEEGLKQMNDISDKIQSAIDAGNWQQATSLWSDAEGLVGALTDGVNFYNILQWSTADSVAKRLKKLQSKIHPEFATKDSNVGDALSDLMNGPVRKMLGIIPDNVTWSSEAPEVFSYLSEDFMKPVIDVVSSLLMTTNVEVTVYSGQLDLIVDTIGTEHWVQKLKWTDLAGYNNATRSSFKQPLAPQAVAGYVKSFKTFAFYWILDAGHMIPSDAGQAALVMLQKVLHI